MRLYLYPRNSSLGVVFSRYFKGSLVLDPRFATHCLFLPATSALSLIHTLKQAPVNTRVLLLTSYDAYWQPFDQYQLKEQGPLTLQEHFLEKTQLPYLTLRLGPLLNPQKAPQRNPYKGQVLVDPLSLDRLLVVCRYLLTQEYLNNGIFNLTDQSPCYKEDLRVGLFTPLKRPYYHLTAYNTV